ncbi:cytochrome b5 domain-containing protein [Clostridium kluyveri]|uniref:cytochrome b5 domain-containing protein n=1 Tax=Clostridium kluyveri TaxID=1534 RepID=UPI00224798DC|nr:cytochrome b5 domain-containing protein [Clostridium kluyveri]UZQ51156.1 steroid-binding protein [Clostridium kluyveri]
MDSHTIQRLYDIDKRINYYTLRMMAVGCPYIKNYYGGLIKSEAKKLNKLVNALLKNSEFRQNKRQFTLEELSKYNGANGAPAYVAVNGVVYDLSLVPSWGGGTHFGLYAGKDLTSQFTVCHKENIKVLQNLPKVGVIKK